MYVFGFVVTHFRSSFQVARYLSPFDTLAHFVSLISMLPALARAHTYGKCAMCAVEKYLLANGFRYVWCQHAFEFVSKNMKTTTHRTVLISRCLGISKVWKSAFTHSLSLSRICLALLMLCKMLKYEITAPNELTPSLKFNRTAILVRTLNVHWILFYPFS